MGYDGSLKFDTAIDSSGFNAGIGKLGSIAKGGMVVLGAAVASGVAAFGAITKASLNSVASLEQNIGGVETLFKNSANTVIENSKRAYETAGMSANEYMSTVTSFSASLLQSLGNDTVKAAKDADMAIIDMSDNANKMGTDISLIQNAYQGFAKQNYTMLDNLKLGYGGTKSEMERLLKDAEKIKAKNGEVAKYSINSFDDIVQAIHVVQEEMGITGTTAAEAASTIEGSMNSAKAACDNFLNGTISAKEFADAIGIAAENIINNLGEIVPRLAEAIPEVAGAIYEQFTAEFEENGAQAIDAGTAILTNMMLGISEALPGIVDTAVMILDSLIGSINENLPSLLSAGGQLLIALINGVAELLPSLVSLALNIITTLLSGLKSNAPQIISQGQTMFSDFCDVIKTRLPELIASGTEMIVNLLSGLIDSAPQIISQVGSMMNSYLDMIWSALPSMLESGAKIISSLLQGLVRKAPDILAQAATMMIKFTSTIASHLPEILAKGIEIIAQLSVGVIKEVPALIGKIPGIISQIGNAFMNTDWGSIGINIISGIAIGIKNAAGSLVSAAVQAAKDAVNAVKGWLGIKSPSRRMRDEVGKYMGLGVGIGFKENIPVEEMSTEFEGVVKTMQSKVGGVTRQAMKTSGTIVKEINDNYTGNDIDYEKLKNAQLEAMNEANEKPVVLGTRQVRRALKDGGVVMV